MTGILRTQLMHLAATVADLKDRVRVAVAGELGRAVGDAVRQVVEAIAAGRPDPPRTGAAYARSAARWADDGDGWGRPHDPWADDPADDGDRHPVTPTRPDASSAADAGVSAAVAAGVLAARWWLRRRGTWLAAAGVGLGVGLLGVLGGPVARTAVAVLAAAADLWAATDSLGAGAARLDPL